MSRMKLDEWMGEMGLDDDAVAERLKVDRSTVSRLRRGLQRPSLELSVEIELMTGGAVRSIDWLGGERVFKARRIIEDLRTRSAELRELATPTQSAWMAKLDALLAEDAWGLPQATAPARRGRPPRQ